LPGPGFCRDAGAAEKSQETLYSNLSKCLCKSKLTSITDLDLRNAEREKFIANCAIDYAEEQNFGNGEAPNSTTKAKDEEIFESCVTDDVINEFMTSSQTNGKK
jgi:hypothetical protein